MSVNEAETRSGKGSQDPAPYALRGTLPFLAQSPPNILPALTFLTRFMALLQSPASSAQSIFISTLPSQTSFSIDEILVTSSPTLNFLQLALITIQRAPGPGVSGVQARGTDGGVSRDWEGLVGRYTRMSGSGGLIGQKEVQEVSRGSLGTTQVLGYGRNRGQEDPMGNGGEDRGNERYRRGKWKTANDGHWSKL